jgi:hypothetical protein
MGIVHHRGDEKEMKKSVIKALRAIPLHNGKLMPEDVVNAARPKTSPLHSHFQWDDTAAAKAFRLWQARQLIRVTVEYLEEAQEKVEVFVSLSSDRKTGGGYRTTVEVLSDEEMRAELLESARKDMLLFKRKYRQLTELAKVFEAMDSV